MGTYDGLASELGIDTTDPINALARDLVEADDDLLEELVRLRKASGLKAADVARAIGRDRSAVTQFEKLTADPRLSTVRRYALAIGARITHRIDPVQGCAPAPTGSNADFVFVPEGIIGSIEAKPAGAPSLSPGAANTLTSSGWVSA